jgi:hypothetical protein
MKLRTHKRWPIGLGMVGLLIIVMLFVLTLYYDIPFTLRNPIKSAQHDILTGLHQKEIVPNTHFTLEPLNQLKHQGILTGINQEELIIPGLERSYHFLVIADMHVIVPNEEVREEEKENVNNRLHLFTNANGKSALEMFQAICDVADELQADGILLLGDIVDFYSLANAEAISMATQNVETPLLAIGADHDYHPFYSNVTDDNMQALRQSLSQNPIDVLTYDDLIVVGIDNNTDQLTGEAWTQLQQELTAAKPVLLAAHVPFLSDKNPELGVLSEEVWGGRKLLWGPGCTYQPDATTNQLLDAILDENTPVEAVLSGHLHFSNRSMLSEKVSEFVFEPTYTGVVTIVEVKPE